MTPLQALPTTALMPKHIAIVMDGNGRWAQQRFRPRTVGHRAGARAVNRTIDFCLEHGICALTLFAFSCENWGRPQEEVDALMQLFIDALDREVSEMHRLGVQIRFIGQRSRFQASIAARMAQAEELTANNDRLILSIAASYGGQQDITQAARSVAYDVAAGRLAPDDITHSLLAQRMALADLPAPDLFIRTGGETRISNFMLWQLAYTELWFTDVLWPEMDGKILQQALNAFACRERRYGLTSGPKTAVVKHTF